MNKLEDITPYTTIRGILPDSLVTVISVQWFGSEALELILRPRVLLDTREAGRFPLKEVST